MHNGAVKLQELDNCCVVVIDARTHILYMNIASKVVIETVLKDVIRTCFRYTNIVLLFIDTSKVSGTVAKVSSSPPTFIHSFSSSCCSKRFTLSSLSWFFHFFLLKFQTCQVARSMLFYHTADTNLSQITFLFDQSSYKSLNQAINGSVRLRWGLAKKLFYHKNVKMIYHHHNTAHCLKMLVFKFS